MSIKELEKQSDERLQKSAREGDDAALEILFQRYRIIINAKANLYFLVGGDKDDLVQEGMIGLFRAIMDYNDMKNASFRTFAELCINRQLLTAVKRDARLKNSPLNTSLSLQGISDDADEESGKIEKMLADKNTSSPEEEVLVNDQMDRLMRESVKNFSKMELAVWYEYINGMSYTEIAEILGKSPKTIDNATQRIKKKVEKILNLG